jgi:hypothetical protein
VATTTRSGSRPEDSKKETWHTAPGDAAVGAEPSSAPLAARQAIGFMARAQETVSPESSDGIHAVAVANSIVTPWSSMIVLVDDRQREALRRASEQDDRFDREVERGGSPQALELFATLEPGEWLLLALAMLGLFLVRQRQEALGLAGWRSFHAESVEWNPPESGLIRFRTKGAPPYGVFR